MSSDPDPEVMAGKVAAAGMAPRIVRWGWRRQRRCQVSVPGPVWIDHPDDLAFLIADMDYNEETYDGPRVRRAAA